MFLIDKIDVVAFLCEGRYEVLAGRSVSKAVERALEPEGESWQSFAISRSPTACGLVPKLLWTTSRECMLQLLCSALYVKTGESGASKAVRAVGLL